MERAKPAGLACFAILHCGKHDQDPDPAQPREVRAKPFCRAAEYPGDREEEDHQVRDHRPLDGSQRALVRRNGGANPGGVFQAVVTAPAVIAVTHRRLWPNDW